MRILLLVTLLALLRHLNAKCAMTAPGYYNETTKSFPCVPHSDPFVLPDSFAEKLISICDEYKKDDLVCCNTTQVDTMVKNFQKIDISLWHCPACMTSFKRLWCDFTCNKNQADFVGVLEMQQAPYEKFIQRVYYEVSPPYEYNFWMSCKNNKLGMTDMESQFGNVRNLLQGMVDLQGDYVSPLITYTYSDKNGTGYDGNVVPCREKCFCAYCSEACQNGPKLIPDYSCRVFNMSCTHFGIIVLSVLMGLFIVALVTAVIQRWFKWYRNISDMPKSTVINTTRDPDYQGYQSSAFIQRANDE